MITMITFLALAHMLDATQMVWGGGDDNVPCTLHTCWMLRRWSGAGGDDNVPCTCTHVGCYTNGLGWVGVITFLGELSRIW